MVVTYFFFYTLHMLVNDHLQIGINLVPGHLFVVCGNQKYHPFQQQYYLIYLLLLLVLMMQCRFDYLNYYELTLVGLLKAFFLPEFYYHPLAFVAWVALYFDLLEFVLKILMLAFVRQYP